MTYTIIGGVNGVGKSSLIGVLSSSYNDLGTIINPNRIIADNNGDKLLGGKISVELINNCLEMGIDFTQETTLSGHQPVITAKKAKEYNYYIRLFYVGINSLDESLSRIENRVNKGGHDIPKDIVEKRFSKRFDDLSKILPYCNEGHLFDNENGFREVAEYRNGKLIIKSDNPPKWLLEYKANNETAIKNYSFQSRK